MCQLYWALNPKPLPLLSMHWVVSENKFDSHSKEGVVYCHLSVGQSPSLLDYLTQTGYLAHCTDTHLRPNTDKAPNLGVAP